MPKLRVVSGDQTGNKPTRKLGRHARLTGDGCRRFQLRRIQAGRVGGATIRM